MNFFLKNLDDEEEEDEGTEAGIDDALIGELDDGILDEGEVLLAGELDPILKSPLDVLTSEDEEDPLKEVGVKVFDEEEDEEEMDYDSFDDHDEM